MGLKSFNPYTASRRFMTVLDKSHITKETPEKNLLEPKKRSGGRNNHGEVVVWHRGGGHKKQYRVVDFRRDKDGVSAKVASIEYDPNRSANIALLHYADGDKRYILHPVGLEVGATVSTGEAADILPGNSLKIRNIPPGTMVHNLELYPGRGGQAVRSPGGTPRAPAEPTHPLGAPARAALLREPKPAQDAQPMPRQGTTATARRCCLPDRRASG